MNQYYHFTSYQNLESICQNGLIPQKGSRTMSIGDQRCGVFLSKGIPNTILMYDHFLFHYQSHSGKNGKKGISFFKERIKINQEWAKEIPPDENGIAEIEAMKKAIEWIKQIMKYQSFSEYIQDGCYLSVSGIQGLVEKYPEDCYTTETIPPKKIKVVTIKNKETGERIEDREKVLAYFMSMTPMESIIKGNPNVITRKTIQDLYADRAQDILFYNSDQFQLEEIPISDYVQKRKNLEIEEER